MDESEEKWRRFRRLLRERHMTLSRLAMQARVGRCHLGDVLRGSKGRGRHTRKHIEPLLSDEEKRALGWVKGGGVCD